MKALCVALLAVAAGGCTTLTSYEKQQWGAASAAGVQKVKVCSPGAAAGLNLIAGLGNVYLAGKTENAGELGWWALNFLTWPLSILWAVPDGAISADNINIRETLILHGYRLRPPVQVVPPHRGTAY